MINDTRGGAAVKKWAWIMLAAAVLVALCSPREVSQDVPREVSAAEAKEQLEMLGSREIDHLEIFDWGDEYTISDPAYIEEIRAFVRRMEPKSVADLSSSKRCINFYYADGTRERLGQPRFSLKIGDREVVFVSTIDGIDSNEYFSTLFAAFAEEAEACLPVYREALLACEFSEIEMTYEGFEAQGKRLINTKAELDAVRDVLQQAEFRTRGWSGKDAELMKLVIRCGNGEEHVLTLPCFDVETSYGTVRCSMRSNMQERMDEALWDMFGK